MRFAQKAFQAQEARVVVLIIAAPTQNAGTGTLSIYPHIPTPPVHPAFERGLLPFETSNIGPAVSPPAQFSGHPVEKSLYGNVFRVKAIGNSALATAIIAG